MTKLQYRKGGRQKELSEYPVIKMPSQQADNVCRMHYFYSHTFLCQVKISNPILYISVQYKIYHSVV